MITTFLNDKVMDRFKDMKETGELTKSEFFAFSKLGFELDYSIKATSFLKQKLSNQPIRAYFVSKIGEWILAEKSTFSKYRNEEVLNKLLNAQLPFIFETVITIQYLHNQILDAKAGVTTRDRIAENLLSANLLKDQLYRYIRQELPTWSRLKVENSVRKCFEYVDMGQMLEIKANRYDAFKKHNYSLDQVLPATVIEDINLNSVSPFINKLKADLPSFLHQQLDIYFHRIYLTCAALFVEATALIGDLLQLSAKKLRPLLQFSTTYGLMRQLVNDNADWVPSHLGLSTNDKTNFDGFSDLRNATLTLPLIFFLAEEKKSLIHDVLNKTTNWDIQLESPVFNTMIHSQALYQSIQNTRILGEIAVAFLPQEIMVARYLADSCEIVHWNKFLAPCIKHSAYKEYRKTTYYKQTKRLIKTLRKQRILDQQLIEKNRFSFPVLPSISETFPLAVWHLHQLLNNQNLSKINSLLEKKGRILK